MLYQNLVKQISMFSLFWMFMGLLVGLLITSVFSPPARNVPTVPTPNGKNILHTGTGCVHVKATEVPCSGKPTSLNFIASQHK